MNVVYICTGKKKESFLKSLPCLIMVQHLNGFLIYWSSVSDTIDFGSSFDIDIEHLKTPKMQKRYGAYLIFDDN